MTYCDCDHPSMNVEVDDGCRRCGRPVNFAPLDPSTVDVQFETAYGQTTRLPFVVRCF